MAEAKELTVNWNEIIGWGKSECAELRTIGYAYIEQGKYQFAKTVFEGLTILAPNNLYDKQTLAALYLELGQYSHALEEIDRLLSINPDYAESHPEVLLNRAKALYSKKMIPQALSQARALESHENPKIADGATALVLLLTPQL